MEIVNVAADNLVRARYLFNGSIFEKDARLYMAYRANNSHSDAKIYINELDKVSLQPIGLPVHLKIPKINKQTKRALFEDPRMFWYRGDLYCAYVYLREGYSAQAQGLAKLDKNFKVTNFWFIDYKYNHNQAVIEPYKKMVRPGVVCSFNPGTVFEKNWSFFEHAGELMFIYRGEPHTVVHTDLQSSTAHETFRSKISIPWEYGSIRGGTPPILLGDRYLTFFHSMRMSKAQQLKIYYAGAYTFKAEPPFDPVAITRDPLLVGDLTDKTRVLWKHVVVFPCGAVKIDKNFLVSYGHNDYCLKLLKISEEELESKLTKI
jgi:predicted GH43/DUF377 family glycosyl hydrolase